MATMDLRYAMPEFTMAVMSKVEIHPELDTGFKNFFTERENVTKGIKLFVERQGRPVAVDVDVQEKGITTRRDKSTQRNYIPPTFDYKFNYSALEEFEPLMGATSVSGSVFAELVDNTAKGVQENADRIARRAELQRSQALHTGIVTMNNGDNITFPRQAESMVAYDTDFGWDVDTNSPDIILTQGAEFLIENAKVSTSTTYQVLAGKNALQKLKDNPIFQGYADNRRYTEVMYTTTVPREGLVGHGTINAGNFRFNLWGYPAKYDHPTTGASTSYLDDDTIIILPDSQEFSMQYCGVKGWPGDPYAQGSMPRIMMSKMYQYERKDIEGCNLEIGLRSSFSAILDNIDAVFTAQVTTT